MKQPLSLVVISQVYPPDPASVGQFMADVAEEMARRVQRVTVYTSARGYENPRERYARKETRNGVHVRRIPFAWFGKGSLARRMVGGVAFTLQTTVRAAFQRRVDVVLVSTTPPIVPAAALLLRLFRRAQIVYWVMDLNPDQLVALGRARPGALSVRAFEQLNRWILSAARRLIVLDRSMLARLNAKMPVTAKSSVVSLWPHAHELAPAPTSRASNEFRRRYVRDGRLAVLYSGNHSPANPIATLLRAAESLRADDRVVFLFVGGGDEKAQVDAVQGDTIVSLPYQPIERVHESLAAADIHVVTMGDAVVGIVHPSKIYAALGAGRPVLYIGPGDSVLAEMVERERIGWSIRHGDVAGVVAALEQAHGHPELLAEFGERSRRLAQSSRGHDIQCGRICDLVIEAAVGGRTGADTVEPATLDA